MTALIAGLPGGMEWVILLVVALLLFGGTRLAGMGKGAGRAIREFKEEVKAPTEIDSTPAGKVADVPRADDINVSRTDVVDAEVVTPETRRDV